MKTQVSLFMNKINMRGPFLLLMHICIGISSFFISNQQVYAQQQYPVQIQPTVTFPSTFLNDYGDPANTNIRVYLADLTKFNYKINIRIKLNGTGVSYESKNGIVITMDGGQVYFLNDQELSALFALTDLNTSASSQNQYPNSLPEGVYNLAVEAFDASLQPSLLVPVSNYRTDFTIFNVVRYDPPLLNSPANGQAFDLQTINQNIFFNWTPRSVVYSPKQQVQYRFRLINVIPVDRNPYDAVNATVANKTGNIDESNLDFPTFIYSPTDLPLCEGCVYAWQVQAYEIVNGVVSTSRFKNDGFSEVFTFSVKENCDQIKINPVTVAGSSVTISWSGMALTYSEYELDYRPSGTSLPWSPISTTEQSLTLDNTILQTGVTYEFTVKARCKNWQPPVYGGTFKLEQASCVAPAPVNVTTTSAGSVLSWDPVANADSIHLFYKQQDDTGPFTLVSFLATTQTYTLPALNQGGYTIRVDAVCGTDIGQGIQNSFDYNETGIVGPCAIPTPFQLNAQRIAADTANLTWNNISANNGYSITYWHKDSVNVTHTISSLIAPTTKANLIFDDQVYAYQITYMCGTKSTTTPVGMFRIDASAGPLVTDPATADCFPPVDLQAQARSTTSALFEWNKIDGADEYQMFYGVKGSKQFTPFNTTGTSTTLKDLQDSQKYQFVVRVRCGGIYSIFSDTALVDLGQTATSKNCDTVQYVKALNASTTNILLAWSYKPAYTGYIVTYREASQPPSTVYTQAYTNMDTLVQNNLFAPDSIKITFQNLKPGTQYVFVVQAVCGADKAYINAPYTASTLPDTKSSGTCGSENACDKTSKAPLTSLDVGQKFYCADYEVTVDQVTATSSASGTYTGTGHMAMPIPGVGDFVTMSISFKSITINTDPSRCVIDGTINIDSMNAGLLPTDVRNQISGYMDQVTQVISQANDALTQATTALTAAQQAVQAGTDYFQGGSNVGSVVTGELGETPVNATIPKTTSSASVSGNNVTIGGATVAVSSLPVLLKDNAGSVFQVTSTGAVTYVGAYDATFAQDPTVDVSNQVVTFTENSTATYDFDAWQPKYANVLQIEREYELIGISYHVPAKFITPGALDKVNASISTNSADAKKVVFANGKGFVYNQTPSGTSFTLNLGGGPAGDGQYIYAWYVDGTTKTAIGKLLLPSYAPQTKSVVIVPVGTKGTYNATTYQNYLNQTYNKVGITYTVTIDNSFRNNTSWSPTGTAVVQASGSGLLSNDYQGEEKDVITAYVTSKGGASGIDPNTAYFMAVYEASNIEDGLLGKMPPEEQFGFLYSGGTNDAALSRTMAHELGHGAYHMEHTFIALYFGDSSKGTTKNLMDYSNGNELWKFQWDIIQDPGHVWGILKKDSDAQAVAANLTNKCIESIRLLRLSAINQIQLDFNKIQIGCNVTSQIKIGSNNYSSVKIEYDATLNTTAFKAASNVVSGYNVKITLANSAEALKIKSFLDGTEKNIYGNDVSYIDMSYCDNNGNERITLNSIATKMEGITVSLLKNNTYYDLDEYEKVILDIPIMLWNLGMKYGAVFQYNWFNGGNRNICFTDQNKTNLLDKSSIYTTQLNDAITEINNGENYYVGDLLWNQHLKNIRDRIIDLNNTGKNFEYVVSPDYVANQNSNAFKIFSVGGTDFLNTDNQITSDLVASFGSYSLNFVFSGTLSVKSYDFATLEIEEIKYRIYDSFDFSDAGSAASQNLGYWQQNPFSPQYPGILPAIGNGILIENKDYSALYTHIYNSTYDNNNVTDFYIYTKYYSIDSDLAYIDYSVDFLGNITPAPKFIK